MGPVSFQPIGEGLDRVALLDIARRLRAAGIAVQSVDGDRTLLVRSEDFDRAIATIEDSTANDGAAGDGAAGDGAAPNDGENGIG